MTPRFAPSQGRIIRALGSYLSKDRKNLMTTALPPDAFVVEAIYSAPWASLTFIGERHHLVLRLSEAPCAVPDGTDLAVAGAILAVERATWLAGRVGGRLTIDLLAIDLPT